jgi:hypothetical protein
MERDEVLKRLNCLRYDEYLQSRFELDHADRDIDGQPMLWLAKEHQRMAAALHQAIVAVRGGDRTAMELLAMYADSFPNPAGSGLDHHRACLIEGGL